METTSLKRIRRKSSQRINEGTIIHQSYLRDEENKRFENSKYTTDKLGNVSKKAYIYEDEE